MHSNPNQPRCQKTPPASRIVRVIGVNGNPPRFRTLKGAEKWCHATWQNLCACDLEGADVKLIKPVLRQLQIHSLEYPATVKWLSRIGMNDADFYRGDSDPDVIMSVAFGNEIYFNRSYFGLGCEDDVIRFLSGLTTISTSLKHLASHEFGHILHYSISCNPSTQEKVKRWTRKWYRRLLSGKDWVSEYALENEREMFAEAFTAMVHYPPRVFTAADSLREMLSEL